MLTPSEIRQAVAGAAADTVEVLDRSQQRETPLEVNVSLARTDADRERGPVKVRATTTVDEPELVARRGRAKVTFTVERVDPANPRWLATQADGTHTVLHGAGDVVRALEASGLPLADRRPQLSKLTGGELKPLDTAGLR